MPGPVDAREELPGDAPARENAPKEPRPIGLYDGVEWRLGDDFDVLPEDVAAALGATGAR